MGRLKSRIAVIIWLGVVAILLSLYIKASAQVGPAVPQGPVNGGGGQMQNSFIPPGCVYGVNCTPVPFFAGVFNVDPPLTPTYTPMGTRTPTNTFTPSFTANLTNTITPTPSFTATPNGPSIQKTQMQDQKAIATQGAVNSNANVAQATAVSTIPVNVVGGPTPDLTLVPVKAIATQFITGINVANPPTPDLTKAPIPAVATQFITGINVANPPTPNQTIQPISAEATQVAVNRVISQGTPGTVGAAWPVNITSGATTIGSGVVGNQQANGQTGMQSLSNLYVYDAKSGFETLLKGALGTGGGVGTILPVDLRGVETTYRASFNLATNATDNWALFNPNASGVTMCISGIMMNFSASTPAFGAVTFTRRTTPDFFAGATVTPTPYTNSKSYTSDGAAGGVFIPWLAGPTPGTADSDCFVYQAYYASSAASELLTTVTQSNTLVWPPHGWGGGNKPIALLPGQSFIFKGTNPTGGNIMGTVEWIEY